jgi:signal-transduction protein with cAMP-binding, CBS, and nucleotidyltransferase domain
MKITVRDAINYVMVVKDNKILGIVQDIDLHTMQYTQLAFEEGKTLEEMRVQGGIADFVIVGPIEKVVEFAKRYEKGEV